MFLGQIKEIFGSRHLKIFIFFYFTLSWNFSYNRHQAAVMKGCLVPQCQVNYFFIRN